MAWGSARLLVRSLDDALLFRGGRCLLLQYSVLSCQRSAFDAPLLSPFHPFPQERLPVASNSLLLLCLSPSFPLSLFPFSPFHPFTFFVFSPRPHLPPTFALTLAFPLV